MSRFGDEQPGSNPEELIGAAQAACYAMQLAAMLGEAGTPANSISATANVELSFVDNAQSITKISIEATGDVPGLSEDEFKAKAEEAKAACSDRARAGRRTGDHPQRQVGGVRSHAERVERA